MRLLRLVPLVSGVVALGWMLGPGAAFAREEADFGRTGFYIGVGGALTKLLDADDKLEEELSAPVGVSVDTEYSFGANARVGYRFHSHFAAEVEADWHNKFDVDYEYGKLDVAKGKVKPWVFTANAKAYLFKDRFQPYAVAGIGAMTANLKLKDTAGLGLSDSKRLTDFAARLGGGADMYVTEHIVLNAEIRYVLPTGAVYGLDMISFGWGLQYRF